VKRCHGWKNGIYVTSTSLDVPFSHKFWVYIGDVLIWFFLDVLPVFQASPLFLNIEILDCYRVYETTRDPYLLRHWLVGFEEWRPT
jgi:hypothetical protein